MKYYLSNAACDTPLRNAETFFYDWISGEDTALRLPNSILDDPPAFDCAIASRCVWEGHDSGGEGTSPSGGE
ncbi:MAG: hypothetical protein ACYC4U_08305 [Pirellulaceae bacterium]